MSWLRTPSPSSTHLGRPLVGESAPIAPPPAPSSSFIMWPSPCGGGMLAFGCTASQSSPLSGWFSLTVCTIYFLLFFNLYLGMCSIIMYDVTLRITIHLMYNYTTNCRYNNYIISFVCVHVFDTYYCNINMSRYITSAHGHELIKV